MICAVLGPEGGWLCQCCSEIYKWMPVIDSISFKPTYPGQVPRSGQIAQKIPSWSLWGLSSSYQDPGSSQAAEWGERITVTSR